MCRFIALQNEKAAKLQKLNFLATLYSFVFDLLLFDQPFSVMQYIGLACIFALYVFQLVMYKINANKVKVEKEAR